MTALDVLAQHVDQPATRHRCVLLDPLRIRCLDCSRTIDLRGLATSAAGSTSTSESPLPLHDPERCPNHPGQRAGTCGPCRAEQLEAQRTVPAQPTADVAAGIAAARAALAEAVARRHQTTTDEAPA